MNKMNKEIEDFIEANQDYSLRLEFDGDEWSAALHVNNAAFPKYIATGRNPRTALAKLAAKLP